MNERIRQLAEEAELRATLLFNKENLERFAKSIVYDFLSELTNDDALGEARINTIQRLAEKWGVAR